MCCKKILTLLQICTLFDLITFGLLMVSVQNLVCGRLISFEKGRKMDLLDFWLPLCSESAFMQRCANRLIILAAGLH